LSSRKSEHLRRAACRKKLRRPGFKSYDRPFPVGLTHFAPTG